MEIAGIKVYPTFGLMLGTIGLTASVHSMPTQLAQATLIERALPVVSQAIPPYKHIFVIIAENKAYKQIIGSPNAPKLNQLAQTYGSATKFYGEIHPSEGNYAAMLGGSNFGIHDDDAFYCQAGSTDQFCSHAKRPNYANHTIVAKSLMDQLTEKGLTWKGYFEDLPSPGSKAVVYPDVKRALYAVKHNGFMNYKVVQDDPQIAQKIVGFDQLATDLKTGNLPNYSHIILNQCNEMHGLEECPNTEKLIQQGDTEIGKLVDRIMGSSIWAAPENSAIVVTFDEDNFNPVNDPSEQGCCGFDPNSETNYGGGHIATIVITNHGPRGVVDATPYNHYSLLRTTEDAFGITEYLKAAGDTDKGVKSMTPLFAVTSSNAKSCDAKPTFSAVIPAKTAIAPCPRT
jgi:phosphatidylinositol-3-phosphatase